MSVEAIHLGALDLTASHLTASHPEALQAAPRPAELRSVDTALAVAGKGLEGDRHFHDAGAPAGQALTLVEAEVVEDVGLRPGETRRQVTVRGVSLNELVGRRFRIGEVECVGVELCEPCSHLESMTRPGIIKELVHRAGLNADIVSGGVIRVGDELEPL